MRNIFALILLLPLVACKDSLPKYDMAKRHAYFMECMKALPTPSQQIKYLGDAVDGCASAARDLSELTR